MPGHHIPGEEHDTILQRAGVDAFRGTPSLAHTRLDDENRRYESTRTYLRHHGTENGEVDDPSLGRTTVHLKEEAGVPS